MRVVALGMVVALVALTIACGQPFGNSTATDKANGTKVAEPKAPETGKEKEWLYADLVNHFVANGMYYTKAKGRSGRMYFIPCGKDPSEERLTEITNHTYYVGDDVWRSTPDIFCLEDFGTRETAKKNVEIRIDQWNERNIFAWNRFAIRTHPTRFETIKGAMPKD